MFNKLDFNQGHCRGCNYYDTFVLINPKSFYLMYSKSYNLMIIYGANPIACQKITLFKGNSKFDTIVV